MKTHQSPLAHLAPERRKAISKAAALARWHPPEDGPLVPPNAVEGLFPQFADLLQDACAYSLERAVWHDGFVCPKCGWMGEPYRNRFPLLMGCRHCLVYTSVTAGTVMNKTHTPLAVWFWAACLLTAKPEITVMGFKKQLGLSCWEDAKRIYRKLKPVMPKTGVFSVRDFLIK